MNIDRITGNMPKQVPVLECIVRETSTLSVANVEGPAAMAALVHSMAKDRDREETFVILMDTDNNVVGIEKVAIGTLNMTMAVPREVYKSAIIKNAYAIATAHTHPGYDMTPSDPDILIWQRMTEVGELLHIEYLDSLIVNRQGDYVSINEYLNEHRDRDPRVVKKMTHIKELLDLDPNELIKRLMGAGIVSE